MGLGCRARLLSSTPYLGSSRAVFGVVRKPCYVAALPGGVLDSVPYEVAFMELGPTDGPF